MELNTRSRCRNQYLFPWTTLEEGPSRESCVSQHRIMMLYLGALNSISKQNNRKAPYVNKDLRPYCVHKALAMIMARSEALMEPQRSRRDVSRSQTWCSLIVSFLCSSKVHGVEQASPELPLLRINCHSYFDLLFYTRTF